MSAMHVKVFGLQRQLEHLAKLHLQQLYLSRVGIFKVVFTATFEGASCLNKVRRF